MRRETHTYKTVGDLAIQADVLRPDGDGPHPVVVSLHGGALIMGNRTSTDERLTRALLDAGVAILAIDYRLAPETKLPEIIEDIEDAWAWLHERGPELFQADVARVGVMGGSAGGYLTLVCGHRCRPRPAALVSLFGYGDLIGDWYSQPSPHPRHHSQLGEAEAWQQVSGPQIADHRDRPGDGGAFYNHCRQTGAWPRAVSGWDPIADAARFRPYMPLCNVTSDYPPTVLVHGTADTDVPCEQSRMMAAALDAAGVAHELCLVEGGEHGFGGGRPEQIEQGYRAALRLLAERLHG